MSSTKEIRINFPLLSILAVLLVVFVIFSVLSHNFFTAGNLVNIAQQVAPNLVVAVIATYVITTGGIDLSVGSTLALVSALTAVCLHGGWGSWTTLILMLATGGAVGAVNGYMSAYHGIPPFIVTLASMTFIRGIALLITGGYSIPIPRGQWISDIGQGYILDLPVSALIAGAVFLAGIVVFRQTRFGIYITGIGANEEAVRRSGINTRKVKAVTYILSGVAAALAGVMMATRLGSGSSDVGVGFELDVITAVVLGGTNLFGGSGTIVGSLVGVLLIGIINNGLILLHVSPYYSPIVKGVILLLAVLINLRIADRWPMVGRSKRKRIVRTNE